MKTKRYFILSGSLMLLFIIFTILVKFVGTSAIGPNGSVVGFSEFNGWFHDLTGVHLTLYNITDFVQYAAIAIGLVYAVVGLVQWIKRKSIKKVDSDILWLGAFYIVVFLVYLAFEFIKINYRPVLIDGHLETSYPSSTTVLAITFLLTSIHFSNKYIKNNLLKKIAKYTTLALMLFLVVGRIISGVHWATDIIASTILSSSLILLYYGAINLNKK